MKKLFFSLFITIIVFTNCSSQNEKFIIEINDKNLNQDNLYQFVKKHIELNYEIISILEKEINLNKEILFKSSSENCTSEDEFKLILKKSGINEFNELSKFISLQVENSKNFQLNNSSFFKLSKSEQDELLTKYVDQIMSENSTDNNNKINNCAEKYKKDKYRCQRDLNLHGTFAIIGCFTGPWTCATGSILVLAEHANCMEDALEDYKDCLKG